MRIENGTHVGRVQGVRPKGIGGVDEAHGPGIDSVELSSRAADFRAAMEALAAAPAIREEKVAQLREKVEQGSFDPACAELAARMLPK
jgi:flagellar biosynthesis anti-sigma factor FlgM